MRKIIIDIDSNDLVTGFGGNTCGILTSINSQSTDIAIGVNKSMVETFGTLNYSNVELENITRSNFDLRPQAIINNLGLLKSSFIKI